MGGPRTCRHHRRCSASGAEAKFSLIRAYGSERTGKVRRELEERWGSKESESKEIKR